MIKYKRGYSNKNPVVDENGDYIITVDSDRLIYDSTPYRVCHVAVSDGKVANDRADAETATVTVVDGLEVARGTDTAEATVLDYDGDVTLFVDGQETTKTLANGTVSFEITTDKPAGSEIDIIAESLTDHPAESDSATIEVVSP